MKRILLFAVPRVLAGCSGTDKLLQMTQLLCLIDIIILQIICKMLLTALILRMIVQVLILQ